MAKKKTQTELAPGERRIEVEFAGRKVKGISKEFRTEKEDWSIYRLEDGSAVKVRIIVEDIVLCDEEAAPGTPLIIVRHGSIVSYMPPETAGPAKKSRPARKS
jgi:hypothetical protein